MQSAKPEKIGQNCIIGDNVVFGEHVVLGHNCIIEDNVTIGDNAYIDDGTILRSGVTLGMMHLSEQGAFWANTRWIFAKSCYGLPPADNRQQGNHPQQDSPVWWVRNR